MTEPQSEATAVQKRPTFDMDANKQTPRRNTTNNSAIARATSRTSAVSRRSQIVRQLTMPTKPVGPAPPLWQGIKAIVLTSCESLCPTQMSFSLIHRLCRDKRFPCVYPHLCMYLTPSLQLAADRLHSGHAISHCPRMTGTILSPSFVRISFSRRRSHAYFLLVSFLAIIPLAKVVILFAHCATSLSSRI